MKTRMLISAIMATLAFGCAVDDGPRFGVGETCTTSNDCELGLTCLGNLCPVKAIGQNFCVPDGACTASSCAAGQECTPLEDGTSSLCVPTNVCPLQGVAGDACVADRECATGACKLLACDETTQVSACISAMCVNGTCGDGETMWGDPEDDSACWCTPENVCPQ